jgi:hypothetical protein
MRPSAVDLQNFELQAGTGQRFGWQLEAAQLKLEVDRPA